MGLLKGQGRCRLVRLRVRMGSRVGVRSLMALGRRWKVGKEMRVLTGLRVQVHSWKVPREMMVLKGRVRSSKMLERRSTQDPSCHLVDPKQKAVGDQDTQLLRHLGQSSW